MKHADKVLQAQYKLVQDLRAKYALETAPCANADHAKASYGREAISKYEAKRRRTKNVSSRKVDNDYMFFNPNDIPRHGEGRSVK